MELRTETAVRGPSGRSVVMLVDDNPDDLQILSGLLGNAGYRVYPFRDSGPALRSLRTRLPDLLILESQLPEGGSYKLCRTLRAEPNGQDLPVIFVGRSSSTEDKLRAFAAGGVDYVVKPIIPQEILARIAGQLVLRHRRQTLQETNTALSQTLAALKNDQARLVDMEKQASLVLLAGGLAHEVNNPLGYLYINLNALHDLAGTLLTQLAARDYPAEELQLMREDLQALGVETRQGLDHIRQVVRNLADFARVGNEERTPVDLTELSEELLGLLRGSLPVGVELVAELVAVPVFLGEKAALTQALLNLMINALEAVANQGKVTVRLALEGSNWVQMEVKDTGRGVDPAHLPRITDPFFTTKDVGAGKGLGLSAARGVVERHGGRLAIHSPSGKGTCVGIWLPLSRMG